VGVFLPFRPSLTGEGTVVKGRFNLDDDERPEITISGGLFALVAILAVADLLLTGGENVRWALRSLAEAFSAH
jgi:hypothetical protein